MRAVILSLIAFLLLATPGVRAQGTAATETPTPVPGIGLADCVRGTLFSPAGIRKCFAQYGEAPTDPQITQLLYCVLQNRNSREFRDPVAYCITALGPIAQVTPTPEPTPMPTATATPKPTTSATPPTRRSPSASPTPKPPPSPAESPTIGANGLATPTSTPTPTARPHPRRSPARSPSPKPTPSETPMSLAPPPAPQEATSTPPGFWRRHRAAPYVFASGGAALLIIGVLFPRLKRRRERTAAGVRIVSPADLSIQVCGRNVVFTAQTSPPGRESEIRWEVPLEQFQTVSSGSGPVFTTSWSETGVKQVVARLGAVADDVILYAFKTPSGGATRADILASAPPQLPRRPSEYTWYRSRVIPGEPPERQ